MDIEETFDRLRHHLSPIADQLGISPARRDQLILEMLEARALERPPGGDLVGLREVFVDDAHLLIFDKPLYRQTVGNLPAASSVALKGDPYEGRTARIDRR